MATGTVTVHPEEIIEINPNHYVFTSDGVYKGAFTGTIPNWMQTLFDNQDIAVADSIDGKIDIVNDIVDGLDTGFTTDITNIQNAASSESAILTAVKAETEEATAAIIVTNETKTTLALANAGAGTLITSGITANNNTYIANQMLTRATPAQVEASINTEMVTQFGDGINASTFFNNNIESYSTKINSNITSIGNLETTHGEMEVRLVSAEAVTAGFFPEWSGTGQPKIGQITQVEEVDYLYVGGALGIEIGGYQGWVVSTHDIEQVTTALNNANQVITDNLQTQLDKELVTHFLEGIPDLTVVPYVTWKADEVPDDTSFLVRDAHLGDYYYDTVSGLAYKFIFVEDGTEGKVEDEYSWAAITDSALSEVLQAAYAAQDSADRDMKMFYADDTAVPGEMPEADGIGDLWVVSNVMYDAPNDNANLARRWEGDPAAWVDIDPATSQSAAPGWAGGASKLIAGDNGITGWSMAAGSTISNTFKINADVFELSNSDLDNPVKPFTVDATDPNNVIITLTGSVTVGNNNLTELAKFYADHDEASDFGGTQIIGDSYKEISDGIIYTYSGNDVWVSAESTPSYTWTKYSKTETPQNNSSADGMVDTWSIGFMYIWLAFDQTSDSETTAYGDYDSHIQIEGSEGSEGGSIWYQWSGTELLIEVSVTSPGEGWLQSGPGEDLIGPQGVSINTVTNYYSANTSDSSYPSGHGANPSANWKTTIAALSPAFSEDNDFLWSFEVITRSDASKTYTTPKISARWSLNGRGIDTITELYKANTSGTVAPTSGWTTLAAAGFSSSVNYLWNQETVSFTDGSANHVVEKLISRWGEDGITFQSQINSISFARSAGELTEAPTGGEFTDPHPTDGQGWYDGIPSGSDNPVWQSSRVFTSDGESPQASTWTIPAKVSEMGDGVRSMFSVNGTSSWHEVPATGDHYMATQAYVNGVWGDIIGSTLIKGETGGEGNSTVTAVVYKNSDGSPEEPTTGTGSYNFVASTITPPDTDWLVMQPDPTADEGVWSSAYTFTGLSTDTNVGAGIWSDPVLEAQLGANGTKTVLVELYQTKSTIPAVSGLTDTEYTFASGVVTNIGDWLLAPPTATTTPTYMTRCEFTAPVEDATVENSDWSDAVVFTKIGLDGLTSEVSRRTLVVPCDSDGNTITMDDTSTTVRINEGDTALTPVSSASGLDGRWWIANTSVLPTGSITYGGVNAINGTLLATNSHTNFDDPNAAITYNISGNRSNGESFTMVIVQEFSKVNTGAVSTTPGPRGSAILSCDSDMGAVAPSNVNFTAVATCWTDVAPEVYLDEIEGDQLIITNINTSNAHKWTHIYEYNGTEWVSSTAWTVNGNMVVTGTLDVTAIKVGTVTADCIHVDATSVAASGSVQSYIESNLNTSLFIKQLGTLGSALSVEGNANHTAIFEYGGQSAFSAIEAKNTGTGAGPAVTVSSIHGHGISSTGKMIGAWATTVGGSSDVQYGVRGNITTECAADSAGIYGYSTKSNASGLRGECTTSGGYGVIGKGLAYSFYADGGGTDYGTFTGAHDAMINSNHNSVIGDIIKNNKSILSSGISTTISEVSISLIALDKAVLGVLAVHIGNSYLQGMSSTPTIDIENYLSSNDPDYLLAINTLEEELQDFFSGFTRVAINSLGEGMINVCSINGDIENGDYITSSIVPGKGMKQDSDMLHNYTVAKSLSDVIWNDYIIGVDDCYGTTGSDGIEYKTLIVPCTYHSG